MELGPESAGAEFASGTDLTPLLVSDGHESMLTRPDEVAKALLTGALSQSTLDSQRPLRKT